jgi:hypothetical protein
MDALELEIAEEGLLATGLGVTVAIEEELAAILGREVALMFTTELDALDATSPGRSTNRVTVVELLRPDAENGCGLLTDLGTATDNEDENENRLGLATGLEVSIAMEDEVAGRLGRLINLGVKTALDVLVATSVGRTALTAAALNAIDVAPDDSGKVAECIVQLQTT